MATQAFIIDLAVQIRAANDSLEVAARALQYETANNTDTGGCHKENLDVWGNLGGEISLLLAKGERLYGQVREARRLAESKSKA